MSINKIAKCAVGALVLAGSGLAVAGGKNEVATSDLWLQPAKGGYTVEFVSGGEISGLQFDVKGISVADGQFDCGIGLSDSHIANCTVNSDGNLRVIVFSMDNAPIPDGTMVTIRNASPSSRADVLSASRQAAAPALQDVVFSDAQAVDVTPDHLQ